MADPQSKLSLHSQTLEFDWLWIGSDIFISSRMLCFVINPLFVDGNVDCWEGLSTHVMEEVNKRDGRRHQNTNKIIGKKKIFYLQWVSSVEWDFGCKRDFASKRCAESETPLQKTWKCCSGSNELRNILC